MAQLAIAHDELWLRLSVFEKVAALRGDLHAPLADIQSIDVAPAPWDLVKGWRAAGLCLRRQIAVGTFRGPTTTKFVVLRGMQQAVRVSFSRGAVTEFLVGAADAPALVQRLRAQCAL